MMKKKLALLLFCLSVSIQSTHAFNYGFMSACVGDQRSSCMIVGCTLGFGLIVYGYELWQQKRIKTQNLIKQD